MADSPPSPTAAATAQSDALSRAERDADLTLWLPGKVPMYFRRIPPGKFRMGERGLQAESEPDHWVVIKQEYHLGTFPVTQAQYSAVASLIAPDPVDALSPDAKALSLAVLEKLALLSREGRSWLWPLSPAPSRFKGDLRPVERVSWDATTTWCAACAALLAVDNGARCSTSDGKTVHVRHLGLPNEAQWECACRGGTRTEYCAGDGEERLKDVGIYGLHGENYEKGHTHDVGAKQANDHGLHDMHGNVSEWCADLWDGRAYRKRLDGWEAREWGMHDVGSDKTLGGKPTCFERDVDRVARGGSWNCPAWQCRSAYRRRLRGSTQNRDLGFRVCLVL